MHSTKIEAFVGDCRRLCSSSSHGQQVGDGWGLPPCHVHPQSVSSPVYVLTGQRAVLRQPSEKGMHEQPLAAQATAANSA